MNDVKTNYNLTGDAKIEVIKTIIKLRDEFERVKFNMPEYVRQPKTASKEEKSYAARLTGGMVLNEPLIQNAPSSMDSLISGVLFDKGQYAQNPANRADQMKTSFQAASEGYLKASEEAYVAPTGIKAFFMTASGAKQDQVNHTVKCAELKTKSEQYAGYAKSLEKIVTMIAR